MTEEGLLLEVRPSWWNFFWHLVFFWLIIPLLIAIVKRSALILRIYEDRIVLETGFLSKDITEVFVADVRTIDLKQKFSQRIFKIGDIMISTAGNEGYEQIARGIPDPRGIKELIIAQRRKLQGTND